MTWGFLALALAAAPCTVPPMEAAIQAALPYESFDTREGPYGWRSLSEAGCVDAARQAYAALASGSMRLLVIDGFIACPHESYAKAVHCKM